MKKPMPMPPAKKPGGMSLDAAKKMIGHGAEEKSEVPSSKKKGSGRPDEKER